MRDVWIIGAHSTAFAKRPESTFKDLTRETYLGVLADAGLGDGHDIATAWFGNCLMHTWGQGGIRGQVCTVDWSTKGCSRAGSRSSTSRAPVLPRRWPSMGR